MVIDNSHSDAQKPLIHGLFTVNYIFWWCYHIYQPLDILFCSWLHPHAQVFMSRIHKSVEIPWNIYIYNIYVYIYIYICTYVYTHTHTHINMCFLAKSPCAFHRNFHGFSMGSARPSREARRSRRNSPRTRGPSEGSWCGALRAVFIAGDSMVVVVTLHRVFFTENDPEHELVIDMWVKWWQYV